MSNIEGKTVMIVDDTSFMRKMLKVVLEGAGCTVVAEAGDGADALEKYQEHKPDFVTMDIVMPQMDGIASVKALRSIDPDATIIMVSSAGQDSKVMEAKEAGASNFILKPFEEKNVVNIISSVFS